MRIHFRRLAQSERGNMLATIAVLMPMIVGSGAIAVDTMNWALQKRELQRVADSAAVAAASAKRQDSSATAAVDDLIARNPGLTLSAPPGVEDGPADGPFAADDTAVRVRLQTRGSTSFVSMFRSGPVTIDAEATAALLPDPRYCMLSLEQNDRAGFLFAGNTNLDLDCGLATNSTGQPAILVDGTSSVIRTTEMSAMGDLQRYSNFVGSPKLFRGQPRQPDPYEELTVPTTTPCANAVTVGGGQTRNLSGGCFRGMRIEGSVNFAPGTYVINGGELRFAGNGTITGTGVTFILTGTTPSTVAKLTIEGGSSLTLSAPTSGPYEGVLFYQDRAALTLGNGAESVNTITGNSNLSLTGAVYFPSQRINYKGTGGLRSSCTRLIANRIGFTGTSSAFSGGCTSPDDDLFGQRVRLVE